ncbi:MAG: hypothetical protein ACNFW9_05285 [Candidatus Kerfeldbacteria bacterium]|jgi:H+/Cl- antiporter ClcA
MSKKIRKIKQRQGNQTYHKRTNDTELTGALGKGVKIIFILVIVLVIVGIAAFAVSDYNKDLNNIESSQEQVEQIN